MESLPENLRSDAVNGKFFFMNELISTKNSREYNNCVSKGV